MTTPLVRKALTEALGTAFLVTAVVGSGIAVTRLSPGDAGLQLLGNSLATGGALLALILALQPVSAAFNPVVTLVDRALGTITSRTAVALIAAQILGAVSGCVTANLMFGLPAATISTTDRGGGSHWLAEVIATLGLLLIIFGTVRGGRSDKVAYAVAGYIAAAYWFTSSTSFANPAVTIGRMFSDTFAGIDPTAVAGFVIAQLVGGVLGFLLIHLLYPAPSSDSDDLATS